MVSVSRMISKGARPVFVEFRNETDKRNAIIRRDNFRSKEGYSYYSRGFLVENKSVPERKDRKVKETGWKEA